MKITGSSYNSGEDFLRVRVVPNEGAAEQSLNIEGPGAVAAHLAHEAAVGVAGATEEQDVAQVERDAAAAHGRVDDERAAALKAAADKRGAAVAVAEAGRDVVLEPLVDGAFAAAKARDEAAKEFQAAQLAAEAVAARNAP